MQKMNASDFKAKCLAVLDEIANTGETVMILKRGKPVAQVGPVVEGSGSYPQQELMGSVAIHGDILGPVFPPDAWEAEASPEE